MELIPKNGRFPTKTGGLESLKLYPERTAESFPRRAFNTSMEVGVTVQVEDLIYGGTRWTVCNSYFTFVARSKSGDKVKLEPSVPFTMEEKFQYSMANERRRMRLEYSSSLEALTAQMVDETKGSPVDTPEAELSTGVKASATMVR